MADQFDALLRPWSGRPGIDAQDALDALGRLVGVRYDAKVFAALEAVVRAARMPRVQGMQVVS